MGFTSRSPGLVPCRPSAWRWAWTSPLIVRWACMRCTSRTDPTAIPGLLPDERARLLDHLVNDPHVTQRGIAVKGEIGARLLQRLDHQQRILDRHRLVVVRVEDQQRLHGLAHVIHWRGFGARL